jgi:hypothetical protein
VGKRRTSSKQAIWSRNHHGRVNKKGVGAEGLCNISEGKKNTYTSSKSISLIEVSVENDSSARKQACVVYVSEYLEKQIGSRFYLFRAKISLFRILAWFIAKKNPAQTIHQKS